MISYRTSGGGGFEDPFLRDPALVLSDVVDGKVSVGRASSVYGVVIDEDGQSVDLAATEQLRAAIDNRPMNNTRYRLGVDIGGTFTDGVLIDTSSGDVTNSKVLSTPADPSLGFMSAIEQLVGQDGVDIAEIEHVVHATTVATNAIIEGDTARAAFVTTDGFSDMLEIARQIRPSLYDLKFEKPPPLVPRRLCFGVPERLDADGNVLIPLDESSQWKKSLSALSRQTSNRWPSACCTPTATPTTRSASGRYPAIAVAGDSRFPVLRGRARVP